MRRSVIDSQRSDLEVVLVEDTEFRLTTPYPSPFVKHPCGAP